MSIKAIFPAGVTAMTVNGLHQWDYGQELEIEASVLPNIVEVHFACAGMSEAVVRVCQVKNGKTKAAIPDLCLEQRSPVVAWVYRVDDAGGQTILTITLPIIARIKPPAGTSSPQVADQYAQLIGLVSDQMDALFSGEAPVGRAFEADYANKADHAATADKATNAQRATAADTATKAGHANTAASAAAITTVVPVDKGGTGLSSVTANMLLLGNGSAPMIPKTIAEVADLMGTPMIEAGVYSGTGVSGVVELTFGFVPKILFILAGDGTFGVLFPTVGVIYLVNDAGNFVRTCTSVTLEGTKMTWGGLNSVSKLNISGVVYNYAAFG